MTIQLFALATLMTALSVAAPAPVRAQEYALDTTHAQVTFQVSHLGLSWTSGRFKDVAGSFAIDPPNPSRTRFAVTAKADSVDTDNAKRDEHLRSPDFFDTRQFPALGFQSTAVRAVDGGYQVTGDLTLHGVTKPITLNLHGGKTAEFPKGVHRTGFSGEFKIKRSEFGMDKMLEAIGDDVHVTVSFEGTKK